MDSLTGSDEDRERLKVLLATLTGELSVKDASHRLGVSEARVHVLRQKALEGALTGVSPGRPGRPRKEPDPDAEEVEELRAQVKWLEEELQCALTRTEIALTKPHLLKGATVRSPEKKGSSAKRSRRGSSDGSAGT